MKILKKIWNFLFGKKEESVVVEETPVEEKEESTVQHCASHLRFRKTCPDCLRAVGII
jgi:hypothetical protein|tara:strand:+ start:570 stop:743 length:174 start_codon:yes stop_codon:yes gene_type:complete